MSFMYFLFIVCQIVLINEKDKETAMRIWNGIKNLKPSVEALKQHENKTVYNTAWPKPQLLAGNHSITAMRDGALKVAESIRETNPLADPEISDPNKWPFFTRVNVTVYYGLTPDQALVVSSSFFTIVWISFHCPGDMTTMSPNCSYGMNCS